MACAEFTQVDAQSFTQSVAEGIAKQGGYVEPESIDRAETPIDKFNEVIKRDNLENFHEAVGDKEGLGQKIKGEIKQLGFDPSLEGNPPNVKFRMKTTGGKEVTTIRTPTPTDASGKVNPEFKAFLRHLKANGQKYTMINLQNRTEVPLWKKGIGLDGEHFRSSNLEDLANDTEFKDVLTVCTFDKNSSFFHQSPTKKNLQNGLQMLKIQNPQKYDKIKDKLSDKHKWTELAEELATALPENLEQLPFMKASDKFIEEFMRQIEGEGTGMHVPEKLRENVKAKLQFIQENIFDKKEYLTPKDRQDFIEIAYLFMTDLFIKETGADFYNTSCKDCIDRGGGANWLVLAFMTLLETTNEGRGDPSTLEQRIKNLPAKLEEDAIWARKRGLTHERLERAQSAISRIAEKLGNDSDGQLNKKLVEEFNFAKLEIPNEEKIKTQDSALL